MTKITSFEGAVRSVHVNQPQHMVSLIDKKQKSVKEDSPRWHELEREKEKWARIA